MERGNNRRRGAGRTKQDGADPWGLRGSGELADKRQAVFRQELQHVQRGAQTLGAILGGQQRGQYLLLRRAKGRRDGLLDRRDSAARRPAAQTASAVFQ